MEKKKKFRLFDAILATVCITLVAESVMPTAAIGNSQYFWWIFLIIAFCIPYGMISAELGTTYQSEGGMYDWVKRNGYDPIIIATKLDKINRSQIQKQVKLIRTTLEADKDTIIIPFSATTKQGREEIYEILDSILEEDTSEE